MQKVRLLGINGSARKSGNSQFLLEQAIDAALEIGDCCVESELYAIGGKTFAPCDSCYTCSERGECRVQDDFQELRDKWFAADAIIYSVPVYHMTYPGQLRCFIDRLGNSAPADYYRPLKVVGSIAQGAHLFSGQEHAITDLINHAMIMGCVPATGDMWECYIGAGGWTETGQRKNALEKLYRDGDRDARVAVQGSRRMGRRVVELALIIKTGAYVLRDMLSRDGVYTGLLRQLSSE